VYGVDDFVTSSGKPVDDPAVFGNSWSVDASNPRRSAVCISAQLVTNRLIKAKLKSQIIYATWFEAGSKLVADTFETKFHYAIWFEAGHRQFEPASNQIA